MAQKTDAVYQLTATLERAHLPIWRRLLVPKDATFADLHRILQAAFDWTDSHLHRFTISPSHMKTVYIQSERTPDDFLPASPELLMSEERTKLADVLPAMVKTCEYAYDFGDGWTHAVRFDKELPRASKQRYPACIAGKNAAPPEDSGGRGGYEDLCKTLGNPKSEEYEDMLEWLDIEDGRDFDPTAFDLKETDRAVGAAVSRERG